MSRNDAPKRDSFKWFANVSTRFSDNDLFGHVNNAIYYSYMDTSISRYLFNKIKYDPTSSDYLIFAAENGCKFYDGLSFPDSVDVGLSITQLGNSSFRWRLGMFRGADDLASAVGHFVHVLVERATRRPIPMPPEWRSALEAIFDAGGVNP
ncbi:acyl-CoA thioesterase [Arboricoccus pini]|uniref:acyl-CoA thioesterase n=1 Tax=Arboricoccus pini TaxID=1963835 RepID=UPI000B502C80|nr:thioesterase family protein [Arboricoccus pini]